MTFMTICLIRRNIESGELELDAYAQYDYDALMQEKAKVMAIDALEGRPFLRSNDPTEGPGKDISAMKIRAASDGAVLGAYAFKLDEKLDRTEFWDMFGSNDVGTVLKGYRI